MATEGDGGLAWFSFRVPPGGLAPLAGVVLEESEDLTTWAEAARSASTFEQRADGLCRLGVGRGNGIYQRIRVLMQTPGGEKVLGPWMTLWDGKPGG